MASKRRREAELPLENIKCVIFDIEGTTTPISFVKDTLFGYVKENLKEYLKSNFEEEETQNDILALRELATEDKKNGVEGVVEIVSADGEKSDVIESVINNVKWLMKQDRKVTALKQLQGHMWHNAYKQGKVIGELFRDVVPAFKRLKEKNYQMFIYSSGSVEAQKLLFGHTDDGDLTEYFSGFFDTKVGSKMEYESYKKIAEIAEIELSETLFLTDIPKEAAAAVKAGMRSTLVIRPGNAELSDEDKRNYSTITSFDELESEDIHESTKKCDSDDK